MNVERPSRASSDGVRKSMQSNKSRDTKPELALRRAVHALGLRYRVARRPLPQVRRTADMVFPREKVAVFLDGCFWHGCPEHHTKAKTNAEYWAEKVRRNRERDKETDDLLSKAGWKVIRVWEHQDPYQAATEISEVIRSCRASTDGEIRSAPSTRVRMSMSDDVYVYEAIDIEPPISEEEIAARLTTGDYTKVTWEDPSIGDGYFIRAADDGMIGIAVVPQVTDNGTVVSEGIAIQADPLAETHCDETLPEELRKIIGDFEVTPNGIRRLFSGAIHIERNGQEERLFVQNGEPARISVKS